jgi:phosphoglucomutase
MDKTLLQEQVSPEAFKNISDWLEKPKYKEYRDELEKMIVEERWQDLEDAFFKVIEFGTGGRRGTTGLGSNRINRVTMGESAQALCWYAKEADPETPTKGVVIACDTRLTSEELSKYVASVCAANGFKTYIFESFRSTPELSFAVRQLGCAVGIVVSASHNPPPDNGFKAYWNDGAQLVAPHDKGVLAAAEKITEIASKGFDEAVSAGEIVVIGEEIDKAYIETVVAQAEGTDRELSIVYSPLHGAGQTNTLPVLRAAGFSDITLVEAQMTPDGNFPTIESGRANPEKKIANDRAVALMMSEEADIAITNDPDADRLGVMVRQGNSPIYLTGNQTAVLATDYTFKKRQEKGLLDGKQFIAKTIVTTDMMTALADKYGVQCYTNMLVGFKFIGEAIRNREGQEEFLLGAEESFGLLKGSYARDKDGASGALPVAEYAAELKKAGKTLYDRLLELYGEYGIYAERIETVECPGANGFEQMQHIMNTLRANPLTQIEDVSVSAVLDYQTLTKKDLTRGSTSEIDCTSGNVLVLECENEPRKRFTIRPSGTEPLLKIYTQWYEPVSDASRVEEQFNSVHKRLEGLGETLEGLLLNI